MLVISLFPSILKLRLAAWTVELHRAAFHQFLHARLVASQLAGRFGFLAAAPPATHFLMAQAKASLADLPAQMPEDCSGAWTMPMPSAHAAGRARINNSKAGRIRPMRRIELSSPNSC
jgi:hypothetical protein